MFENIPHEMRAYRQWVCYRIIERDGAKPTKPPYQALTGQLASVTDPSHWCGYDEAVAVSHLYAGIGFVFTKNDPFAGIDLDDTHDDAEAFARQVAIFKAFNSYSELSPSGRGLHIIIKANLVGRGRKRAGIELYDTERFFTMTGNVHHNAPITERYELANILYDEMGGPPQTFTYGDDQKETSTDQEIIALASGAVNGEKFKALFSGDWSNVYTSQSEADFALVDIVAFYTQNRSQIARIFRQSALGQRAKAKRGDYVGYMVEKSFDRQLKPVDAEGLNIAFQKMLEAREGGDGEKTSVKSPSPVNATNSQGSVSADDGALERSPSMSTFPAGLIGEIAEFILACAPRPVPQIALAGAIGLVAGITGRAYNVSGTGLNQYVLMIAKTGRGKEAIAGGISKLMEAVKVSVPSSIDFIGPTEIASAQAVLKWLSRCPCFYSIVGEFGMKMKEMSMPHANPNIVGFRRALLDLYNKSGRGNVLGAMAYSKREDNTAVVNSPAFTLIGESTPETFFENVSEDVVKDGLLPRFMVINYEGPRVQMNDAHKFALPSLVLVEKLRQLVAYSLALSRDNKVCEVSQSIEADKIFRDFNAYCDSQINDDRLSNVAHELWNRAHIKAMKLAALYAIGVNYINPQIDADQARRATDEIWTQTDMLKARFDNGEVGGGSVNAVVNEAKQTQTMVRMITGFATKQWNGKSDKYRISEEMHRARIYPYNFLLMRLQIYPIFKNDRRGASVAIQRTYQQLLDNDDLREIPKQQMQEKYGKSCRAFAISNAERFLEEEAA